MTSLINSKESFTIETCETCGAEFYNVMIECSICGNKILSSEKVAPAAWHSKKDILFKKEVRFLLRAKEMLSEKEGN